MATTMHGFSIKVNDKDGKPQVLLFSSARKTPELLGILKEINAKQRKFDRLVMNRGLLRSRVQSLSAGDNFTGEGMDAFANDEEYKKLSARVEEAITLLEANDDAIDSVNQELCDLMFAFFLKGFVGAGYAQEQAEEAATLIDPNEFLMLRDRCMTGCGAVDFTKRDTR